MQYQFQSEQGNIPFRPQIFTEAIKVLISVNAVVFLIRIIAKNQIDLAQIFGLSSESIWPMIWQPLTYNGCLVQNWNPFGDVMDL